jgi:isoleucyl-tRNA synthetase
LPGERHDSVHLATFPKPSVETSDKQLMDRWERLLDVRSAVQKALEEKRSDKVIGGSLEAKVSIFAGKDVLSFLSSYREDLPSLFIVSQVELNPSTEGELRVEVAHAAGKRCERCWNWSPTVGSDPRYPTIDVRCVKQLDEGWK